MAESIHDQIANALREGLAAIRADAGTTYHFTPDLVDLVTIYPDTPDDFAGRDVVYLLRAGEEEHTEAESGDSSTGIGMVGKAEFFLMLCKLFGPSGEQPGDQPDPSRPRVVNRMVRDALRYLLADVQLGGLAENIIDGSLFVNREMMDAGKQWAMAELRFVVRYSYLASAP